MKALILGGTGLISTGIIKHLLECGAEASMLNRGRRESQINPSVRQITADRNDVNALIRCANDTRYDVVIDMICFTPDQADASIRAFAGRCDHFIFCSTVCTYGVKIPGAVLVDESFPQEPISGYGRNKLECERRFLAAHADGKMNVTIVRPSCTYGPGSSLIDNLEFDPVTWDRIERDLPVLCAGDGLGLWVATHRDDVGKLFAYAALDPRTFGQSYNATREHNFTWRDYYREAAAAIGKPARVLFMPAEWIVRQDPHRFSLLREITQFHGAYTSAKAMRDVPQFVCEIDFTQGAAQTLEDARRRGEWRDGRSDQLYQRMIDQALALGVEPITM